MSTPAPAQCALNMSEVTDTDSARQGIAQDPWETAKRNASQLAAVLLGALVIALIAIPASRGIHPSGDLGLGEGLVGGGTLLLAVATFWMARKTAQLSDETRTGIAASATQFRQERMPVVMPVGERPWLDPVRVLNRAVVMPNQSGGHPEPPGRLPYFVERGDKGGQVVNVPIENVGAGPALGISAVLLFLDQTGARSVAGQPTNIRQATLPALGTGQLARLRFEYRGLALPPLSFQLRLEYRDGAGGIYRVTSTFIEADLAYGPVGFEPPEELRLPGTEAPPIPLPAGLARLRLDDAENRLDDYDLLLGQDTGIHE